MHNNLYTQAVSGIKAPQGAVNRMLDAAKKMDKKIEPIRTRRWTKVALAASLALVILAGSVIGFDIFGGKPGNSFSLTVNALALSENEFAVFESLDGIGGSIENTLNGPIVDEEFGFDCICRGDNIASVTYTVENAEFTYDEKHLADGQRFLSLPDANASSFTVDYADDYDALMSGDLSPGVRLYISLSSSDSTLDDAARKAISDYCECVDRKLSGASGPLPGEPDMAACVEALYGVMLGRIRVALDITFTDGSTQSAAIIFRCEGTDSYGRCDLSAKLAA